MFQMITGRSSGRTWNTCKYALEHNCDIIVAGYSTGRDCVRYLESLCKYYSGSYEYVEAIVRSSHCAVTIRDKEKGANFTINIYYSRYMRQEYLDGFTLGFNKF